MTGKRVISIRFRTDCKEDMELYTKLKLESGTASSLASVAKVRIKESYGKQNIIEEIKELQNDLISAVREEIRNTLNNGNNPSVINHILKSEYQYADTVLEENLPEKSKELPIGALDFLE